MMKITHSVVTAIRVVLSSASMGVYLGVNMETAVVDDSISLIVLAPLKSKFPLMITVVKSGKLTVSTKQNTTFA